MGVESMNGRYCPHPFYRQCFCVDLIVIKWGGWWGFKSMNFCCKQFQNIFFLRLKDSHPDGFMLKVGLEFMVCYLYIYI